MLVVLGGLFVGGCEALEPDWSSHVAASPTVTCSAICEAEGQVCMRNQCAGNTLAVDEDLDGIDDAYVPADCNEDVFEVVAATDYVACCCTSADAQ